MRVLDAGAFIENDRVEGVTTPSVAREADVPAHVEVREPGDDAKRRVREAARSSGDLDVLSRADVDVLALALETGGTLVTNDFAVQNVASRLGVKWEGQGKAIDRQITWTWYCPACGRTSARKGPCPVCGTETKRRPIKGKKR
jgi:UPF0271 protein